MHCIWGNTMTKLMYFWFKLIPSLNDVATTPDHVSQVSFAEVIP